jgi:hypothetical protein
MREQTLPPHVLAFLAEVRGENEKLKRRPSRKVVELYPGAVHDAKAIEGDWQKVIQW